MRYIH